MTAAVAPTVEQVGALLGLRPRPHTVAELDRVVRAGLPYASMRRVEKHFGLPLQPQVRRFIGSRSTLERREVAGRLSRAESERLARPACLTPARRCCCRTSPPPMHIGTSARWRWGVG